MRWIGVPLISSYTTEHSSYDRNSLFVHFLFIFVLHQSNFRTYVPEDDRSTACAPPVMSPSMDVRTVALKIVALSVGVGGHLPQGF